MPDRALNRARRTLLPGAVARQTGAMVQDRAERSPGAGQAPPRTERSERSEQPPSNLAAPGSRSPRVPRAVLLLQHQVGNAAVQRLLGPKPTVSRQQVPAAPATPVAPPAPAAVVLAGSTPLEQAADGFVQATPPALDQAWGVTFGISWHRSSEFGVT
jgi:hypothetical protein